MKTFSVPTAKSKVPGYSELRRTLLIGAPCALATVLSSRSRLAMALDEVDNTSELDRFLAETGERSLALKADATADGQDQYVSYLESAVASINDVSADSLSASSWKGFNPGVFIGVSGRNRACFVVQWKLEPNAFLPPHCHPKTNVCTLGLEGAATLRSFESAPDAPSYRHDRVTEFAVRETLRIHLVPGTTSSLTEYRDNIHLFEAGREGARGIDVTTDYGGDGTFSFLEFDHHRPEDASNKTYRARWIGTDI